MGSYLAHVFGADAKSGIAMFQAINGGQAKRDVLRAASNAALKAEHIEYFNAIMTYSRTAAKARNDFAHHVWGVVDDLPKALLLADPKDWANYALVVKEHTDAILKNPQLAHPDVIEHPEFPRDAIQVYRERDFREVTAVALNTARFLNFLSLIVRWPNNSGLPALLLSEPLFLKALRPSTQDETTL